MIIKISIYINLLFQNFYSKCIEQVQSIVPIKPSINLVNKYLKKQTYQ